MLPIIIIVVMFILSGAVNLLAMPFILQMVLTGLGHDISFWLCLGIWILVVTVLSLLKSVFTGK